MIISLHSVESDRPATCTSPHTQLLVCHDVKSPSSHKYVIYYFLTLLNILGLSIHVLDTVNALGGTGLIIKQVQRAWMDSKNRECRLCNLSGLLRCCSSPVPLWQSLSLHWTNRFHRFKSSKKSVSVTCTLILKL